MHVFGRALVPAAWLVCLAAPAGAQVVSLAGSPAAPKALVLYDDFRAPRIDPAKWEGMWGDFTDLREAVREIRSPTSVLRVNGYLRVALRSYANTWDDTGSLGGPFGLPFANAAALNEVAFTVTVRAAEAVGCPANPGLAAAVAEFRGFFFNDGTGTAGAEGDILAAITVNRFAPDTGPLWVSGFVSRCDDQYCSSQTMLGVADLGQVSLGQPVRLRLKWDQASHQFVFQMNSDPELATSYGVSDTAPPSGPNKYIGLTRVLPNCTSAPRPTAMIDAAFDDVFVNAPPPPQ